MEEEDAEEEDAEEEDASKDRADGSTQRVGVVGEDGVGAGAINSFGLHGTVKGVAAAEAEAAADAAADAAASKSRDDMMV